MVRSADIVVSCVGDPGVMKTSWLKKDAEVINVGTTFSQEHDRLLSDFEGDLSDAAQRYSPVPGGVGPLSVAQLYKNVVRAAWERSAKKGDIDATWERKSASLHRSIHFSDYDSALRFVTKVNAMSTERDHHANISFTHKCVDGVDVEIVNINETIKIGDDIRITKNPAFTDTIDQENDRIIKEAGKNV